MTRPLRIEYEGAVYHVAARGSERGRIFFLKKDYEKFKEYFTESREKHGFIFHCYVLITLSFDHGDPREEPQQNHASY
jgi:putative transposase